MRRSLVITILLLYLSACTHKEVEEDNTSKIIDSALNAYLEAKFSNPYQDTLDRENKFLLAYYQKDKEYLLEYLKDIAEWRKEEERIDETDQSFSKKTELHQLGVREGYRFKYGRSFSPYAICLTTTRNNNKYNLEVHIVKTFYYRGGNLFSGNDTLYNLSITSDQWFQVAGDIRYADFWGMKENNQKEGIDGSSLTVYGINEYFGSRRVNAIYRWSAEHEAIFKAYLSVVKLTNIPYPYSYYFTNERP